MLVWGWGWDWLFGVLFLGYGWVAWERRVGWSVWGSMVGVALVLVWGGVSVLGRRVGFAKNELNSALHLFSVQCFKSNYLCAYLIRLPLPGPLDFSGPGF